VITLISLTTTPLRIDALGAVYPAAHQLEATGEAILFERSLYGKLPADLDEDLVLSVLDVCGAPAQAHRLAKPGMTIAVLGAGGRSGLLCTWIAAQQVGEQGKIVALEYGDAGLAKLAKVPGPVVVRKVNCTDALAVRQAVEAETDGAFADLVINCVNVPGTEMGSILAVRPRGTVYFFSMATSFQAAALGAESVAQDVDLLMGNGYAQGHAEYALNVVRQNPGLAALM
jgi:L-erythro-3,5-diaminohexanoate dehydrogenase